MHDEKDAGGDKDDAREVLGSINGDRSVALSSMVALGPVAVVSTVGAVLGARRGERGGVSSGRAMRPDE